MPHRSFRRRAAAWLFAALTLPAAAAHAQAPELNPHDRERGRAMLRQVRAQIEEHYWDRRFGGVNLEARTAQLDSAIQQATTLGQILASVAALPADLGDSHTFFIPPRQTLRIDYGWEMMMVGDSAFVWKVERGSDAERQGVRPGDRVLSVNGFEPARADLWQMMYVFGSIRPQPMLRATLRAPGGEPRQLELASRMRRFPRILDLTGESGGVNIYTLIREEQNDALELRSTLLDLGEVAVWKLPTFDLEDGAAREVLRRMHRRRALIVDLRGNGGGALSVLLEALGGLYADEVTVARQHRRRGNEPMVAAGVGERAFAGEVVVLVDSRSASAAEVFARNMQLTGRGTVIGDRTAGAVSGARFHPLQVGVETVVLYGVSVTEWSLVMTDGGRLEGVGVTPDTLLLPTAADLAAGADPVLAHALSTVGVAMDPAAAGALFRDR